MIRGKLGKSKLQGRLRELDLLRSEYVQWAVATEGFISFGFISFPP